MPVIYGSKSIIPAPLVSIAKEHQATDDSQPIGAVYTITVRGKLAVNKGSPNSSGIFWTSSGYPPDETIAPDSKLASILAKQNALRSLFATEGLTFEVQPWDGSTSFRCNPRIRRPPEFAEGIWVNECDYTIVLEADEAYFNGTPIEETQFGTYHVSKASEEWNIEIVDETKKTYRLNHSLSATGKRFYDSGGTLTQPAWQNAKDYVLNKIGLGLKPDRMNAPGVLSASLQAFNYIRGQHVNELGGTFSVSETWLCFDPGSNPPAVEDWSVNVRTQASEAGRVSVSVEGTITGLQQSDNNTMALQTTRWANAVSYWASVVRPNLFTRAQAAVIQPLNPMVLNTTIGENQINGTINFHYDYDNRPLPLVAGAISQVVSLNNHNQANVFASLVIPGRAAGPLLQDILTKTQKERTVNLEVQMPPSTYSYTAVAPVTDSIMLLYAPAGATKLFVKDDVYTWVDVTGRYTRTTSWVWE